MDAVDIQPYDRGPDSPPPEIPRPPRERALSGLALVALVGGTAWLGIWLERSGLALILGSIGGILWWRLHRRGPRTIAVQGKPLGP